MYLTFALLRKISNAEIALAWPLHKQTVTAPIIGATKFSYVETTVKAVDVVLTNEEIDYLEAP
nr:aldo/keto reductase [Oceanobacillus arenosus]